MRKTPLALILTTLMSAGINTSLWAESTTTDREQMNGEQMDREQMHGEQMDREQMHGEQMQGNTMDSKEPSQNSAMQNIVNILPANYLEKEIITSNGESVGKINKLVINKEDNTVYAVSGVGGFMGIGEKVVAIPVDKLRSRGDKLVLPSGMTEDALKQEKKYEKSEFSAFEVRPDTSDD